MQIQLGVPEELDDHERRDALDAALEACTISNEGMVKRGIVPTAAKAIKAGKVKWQPEPDGQDEHFDLAPTVLERGHGDCDDLAPWHAGSLRASGTDPDAVAFVKRSGPNRWHALVRRGDGSVEDPSLAAGMGRKLNGQSDAVVGAIVKPMAENAERMCLAICPHKKDPRHPSVWFARLDVPSVSEDWAWTSHGAHTDPKKALTHAIKGARIIGEDDIDGEDEARLAVLHDLLNGHDPYEVAAALEEVCGDDVDPMHLMIEGMQVGSFFSGIAHGLSKIARPFAKIASKALQFVPGVGPIASTALDAAAAILPRSHPAHPANAGKPGHAAAVNALIAQGHPAYAGAKPAAPAARAPGGNAFLTWPPHYSYQPGQPFHPWGASSPAVMRF